MEKKFIAVLVGVSLKRDSEQKINEYLYELEFLAHTADINVVGKFIQRLESPDPRTFVRKGKLNEIKEFITSTNVNLVIFDEELTPSQLRNLNNFFKIEILDRTNLILLIFALRAKTSLAKKQVELAKYQYILPRLAGMWTHLERQRGGIGLRGPGEKEIETDRRIIRNKITRLKQDLQKIDMQKQIQRKNRKSLVRVALIGYTNVGKSTLMNLLTKSDVFAENKLFATLDTTVRKTAIGNLPFLLSDTVGFIRKLPHTLIEAFKSTLDEVREADILLHVVDVSHKGFLDQIDVVNRTLKEIDATDKKTIVVFNKIDLYSYESKDPFDLTPKTLENYSLDDLKQLWFSKTEKSVFISAKQKINIDELRTILYDEVKKIHVKRYPFNNFYYPDFK